MNQFKRLLNRFLPGIFLLSYNVGIGSVTMMSKSGALYGYSLLWVILFSSVMYYYLVSVFSKYTMVTGSTFIHAVKEKIHPGMASVIVAFLVIIILPALMGLMGIMSDVLSEWSSTWLTGRVPSSFWAILISVLIYFFLFSGTTEKVKKILSAFVIVIFFAFLANLFWVFPSAKEIFEGLIPSIPDDVTGSDNSTFLIMAGMVGTTVSSVAFIIRSINIKEAKWDLSHYKQQKKDALLSSIGVFILSATILITAASILHPNKLMVNQAIDLILLLKPIAGEATIVLMAVGILAAGISSHIPNMMVIPWALSDYKSKPLQLKDKKIRILFLVLTLVSIITPVFGLKPVFILLLSQGLLAILLPLIVGCMLYLMNNKVLGDNKNNIKDNLLLGIVFLFSLFMGITALIGVAKDLF